MTIFSSIYIKNIRCVIFFNIKIITLSIFYTNEYKKLKTELNKDFFIETCNCNEQIFQTIK